MPGIDLTVERKAQLEAFLEETKLLGMLEMYYLKALNDVRLKRGKADDFVKSLIASVPAPVYKLLMDAHRNEVQAVYDRERSRPSCGQ